MARCGKGKLPRQTGPLGKQTIKHGLGFLCSLRGSNLLLPAHCLLSKKLAAALIATGRGLKKIADNNRKTIQYQEGK